MSKVYIVNNLLKKINNNNDFIKSLDKFLDEQYKRYDLLKFNQKIKMESFQVINFDSFKISKEYIKCKKYIEELIHKFERLLDNSVTNNLNVKKFLFIEYFVIYNNFLNNNQIIKEITQDMINLYDEDESINLSDYDSESKSESESESENQNESNTQF